MPGVALAKGSDNSSHTHGGNTPAAAIAPSGRRHPHHTENRVERRRRPAIRAGRRSGYLMVVGTGYQQAMGSSRVRSLQRRLANLGFAPGPIDGRYGPLTVGAVERFQATANLTVDGIAGPHTVAALNATRRAVLSPGAGYRLPSGSTRVRAVQRRLAHLGFAPGPIDGRYGPLTTKAIRRFQHTHHLTASGVTGLRTLAALETAGRHLPITPQTPAPPPTVSAASPPVPTHPQPATPLPVGPVLLALAALGLATATHSYWKTRKRLQATRASSRGNAPRPGGNAPGPDTTARHRSGPTSRPVKSRGAAR
jgi:peptidoglycan hydrolase-like protein with peptidoglycan-binding domain